MAERPVFVATEKSPFYKTVLVTFDWNSGLSKTQKQKNIAALHKNFCLYYPDRNVLEISSKSLQNKGVELSAFFLKKYVPSLNLSIPVECIYQSSKKFEFGGPYENLLSVSSRQAKKDERLKNSGRLTGFCFQGEDYPLNPSNIFYDFIYMNALLENPELAEEVLRYDGFTDIEFNPRKGINCQARAAAAFVGISKAGKEELVKDFSSFLQLYRKSGEMADCTATSENEVTRSSCDNNCIAQGMVLHHKLYGDGIISEVGDGKIVVSFPQAGEKQLGIDWCRKNCTVTRE